MKLLPITSMDLDVADQLPIRYSEFARYWRKVGVPKLFLDFEKA
jgi:hypothetical protein